MAKKNQGNQLLRWSDYVPASDVTDPLGLGLRGSTRLASLLLYCITSITPRARYFSFIPWAIYDWQQREKGLGYAFGLREAIKLREKALTYGCVAHHKGHPCVGGALVGSTAAQNWLSENDGQANLGRIPFAKNPALNAYLNSMVNLGLFVEQEAREDAEEELQEVELTFDDIELSALGSELASGYRSVVESLGVIEKLTQAERSCSVEQLAELGAIGGLCELVEPNAVDRATLTDVFLARKGFSDKSHFRRNRSLVLILELCRQLSRSGIQTNASSFGLSVYYGQVSIGDESKAISIPESLTDISRRWRMFYFHHYMGVAIEGMFSWLVTRVSERGLTGASVGELASELKSPVVSRELGELTGGGITGEFGASNPAKFFSIFGLAESDLSNALSKEFDEKITEEHACAESSLESAIRDGTHRHSATGLAVPCVLLALTLGRYRQWEETEYGDWLASDAVVKDPYLDLLPSTVSIGLSNHYSGWWRKSWSELAEYVLARFVVQQHQSMAFEKTATGDRCLLEVDGERVTSDAAYDKVGLGNARLGSAIQILTDLSLLSKDEHGNRIVTPDGIAILETELSREVQ